MVRFQCPNCETNVKAPDDTVGATIRCPSCKQPTQVPFNNIGVLTEDMKQPKTSAPKKPPGRSSSMNFNGGKPNLPAAKADRAVFKLALLAVFAGISLVIAVVMLLFLPENAEGWETTLLLERAFFVIGALAVLAWPVLLLGYKARCPSCHEFWAREKKGENRPNVAAPAPMAGRSGAFVRSVRETRYQCKHCRHKWTDTVAIKP